MEQLLRYDAGPQPAEIFKGRRNDCKLSTTKKRDAFKMFLFLKISGAIARLLPLAAGLHDNINGGCILWNNRLPTYNCKNSKFLLNTS